MVDAGGGVLALPVEVNRRAEVESQIHAGLAHGRSRRKAGIRRSKVGRVRGGESAPESRRDDVDQNCVYHPQPSCSCDNGQVVIYFSLFIVNLMNGHHPKDLTRQI